MIFEIFINLSFVINNIYLKISLKRLKIWKFSKFQIVQVIASHPKQNYSVQLGIICNSTLKLQKRKHSRCAPSGAENVYKTIYRIKPQNKIPPKLTTQRIRSKLKIDCNNFWNERSINASQSSPPPPPKKLIKHAFKQMNGKHNFPHTQNHFNRATQIQRSDD